MPRIGSSTFTAAPTWTNIFDPHPPGALADRQLLVQLQPPRPQHSVDDVGGHQLGHRGRRHRDVGVLVQQRGAGVVVEDDGELGGRVERAERRVWPARCRRASVRRRRRGGRWAAAWPAGGAAPGRRRVASAMAADSRWRRSTGEHSVSPRDRPTPARAGGHGLFDDDPAVRRAAGRTRRSAASAAGRVRKGPIRTVNARSRGALWSVACARRSRRRRARMITRAASARVKPPHSMARAGPAAARPDLLGQAQRVAARRRGAGAGDDGGRGRRCAGGLGRPRRRRQRLGLHAARRRARHRQRRPVLAQPGHHPPAPPPAPAPAPGTPPGSAAPSSWAVGG